ncbi:hypothetical protein [Nocardia sp. NPDC050793]|uniref:hypothetical protein n=1 Tax=Nocardia sp. NPDC050793 TaxID=3155159 RepID=UPI0033F078C5
MAKGIRERSTAFDAATLADVVLPVPPLEEQRRIADFLDAETSRIDKLIDTCRRSIGALRLAEESVIDSELSTAGQAVVRMKFLASVVDTEHKTAPAVPGGGYWIAGTSAVRGGSIVVEALYETNEAVYGEWTRRRRPIPGDILLSREAPVGEVALYRETDPAIAIGQRMVVISPIHSQVHGEYLLWSLMSARTREFFGLVTQGSLHPHLNMSDIGSIPVRMCDVASQALTVRKIDVQVTRIRNLVRSRQRMSDLLAERRQSLITAALTGQFDVTTASGRNLTQGV